MSIKQSEKKQHVEFQRKIKLRKGLIEKAGKLTGAYYVPFIGDGDIACELYQGNKIYGAGVDSERVEVARSRLKEAEIITADCDKFPFRGQEAVYSLADFNSCSYPYDSFCSFWEEAKFGSQCVLFFTDGQKQAIMRAGSYRTPDGKKIKTKTVTEKRTAYNFYFNKTVLPWFKEYIKPWKIVAITKDLRGGSMCYWGAVIELSKVHKVHPKKEVIQGTKFDGSKKQIYLDLIREGKGRVLAAREIGVNIKTVDRHMASDSDFKKAVSLSETEVNQKVENALYEAAVSGNVTAIQVWLYNRDPKRWADRRNIQLAGEGGGPIKTEIIVSSDTAKKLTERIVKGENT